MRRNFWQSLNKLSMRKQIALVGLCMCMLVGCSNEPLNDPHTIASDKDVFFASFPDQPKTLDPAKSYVSNEWIFIANILETPLQYNYLKRPFVLEPLTLTKMPTVTRQRHGITYTLHIKPKIYYQPHPAFAKTADGSYLYYPIKRKKALAITSIADFKKTGTKELTADDYIYQIKRLADPRNHSPVMVVMENHIVGFKEFNNKLAKLDEKNKGWVDLRQYEMLGAKKIDKYTFQIHIKDDYPQFIYWLAMPFFAPVPFEVDRFYHQSGFEKHNISLDWYPVGTGPYVLTENNPNARMILQANPNFHKETFPVSEKPEWKAFQGKQLPFVKQFVFSLERESIPRWHKFLQGYYDQSAVSTDSFDQAIRVNENGKANLTEEMKDKGIKLLTSVQPTIFYLGFNMLDPVIGGYSEKSRHLRQAISIAVNYEEYIAIFLNGSGVPAQGPLPPSIFGAVAGKAGINPYVYDWRNGKAQRKSIQDALLLMEKAGYPNGINQKTGKRLVLNYDAVVNAGPEQNALFKWMRKQFSKLGIQLHIRATQFNRFQDKLSRGIAQIYAVAWHADYPDPENFLFLLRTKNGKVKYGGTNSTNYSNPTYDRLFKTMQTMPNTKERFDIIRRMIHMLQRDATWVFGYFPKTYVLTQTWMGPRKPSEISSNVFKYYSVEPKLRTEKQREWNHPVLWPLFLLFGLLFIVVIPAAVHYYRKQHKPLEREEL